MFKPYINQTGGLKNSSYISTIIEKLNRKHNQTTSIKRHINNSITNTGHGCLFLGSSSMLKGNYKNIRVLVGAQFSHGNLNISSFGGQCNKGEKTIHTIIRETIEEIFNFIPTMKIITDIEEFISSNTAIYYIQQMPHSEAYTYIFDISILGDFIIIINNNNPGLQIKLPHPVGKSLYLTNYVSNDNFTDMSSVHGNINGLSHLTTINIIQFMIDRQIDYKYSSPSLNEIKYLSFPSLFKLMESIPKDYYDLYNQKTQTRERLRFDRILVKILTNLDIT